MVAARGSHPGREAGSGVHWHRKHHKKEDSRRGSADPGTVLYHNTAQYCTLCRHSSRGCGHSQGTYSESVAGDEQKKRRDRQQGISIQCHGVDCPTFCASCDWFQVMRAVWHIRRTQPYTRVLLQALLPEVSPWHSPGFLEDALGATTSDSMPRTVCPGQCARDSRAMTACA